MKQYTLYSAPAGIEVLNEVLENGGMVLQTNNAKQINKYIASLQQNPYCRMALIANNCTAYDYGSWSRWVYVVVEEDINATI